MTYDKSYYQRGEKSNRLEWCSGRAVAFKTIGCGFAPRNCFVFEEKNTALFSFSHVQVGVASG